MTPFIRILTSQVFGIGINLMYCAQNEIISFNIIIGPIHMHIGVAL